MVPDAEGHTRTRLHLAGEKAAACSQTLIFPRHIPHCQNLLPQALPKKCHRAHGDSHFPATSPVKSAPHYTRPSLTLPSVPASAALTSRFYFFEHLRSGAVRKDRVRSSSFVRHRNVPQCGRLFGCVTQSRPRAIDLLRLREEKSKSFGERTPLQLSARSIRDPPIRKWRVALSPAEVVVLKP